MYARAGFRCERCGGGNGPFSIQHRRARGMGGSRREDTNNPSNLVLLDGSGTTGCHGFLESHPALALAEGMRVPQHADPATTPLLIRGRLTYLTPDGRYAPSSDDGDAA